MDEVHVIAPATVANVVCGFDCLGFALSAPFDRMTVRKVDGRGIRILNLDDFGLSDDPERNVAGIAAAAMLARSEADFGIEIEITKQIKPGSGIGSSSASAAGVVFALNQLLDGRFSRLELVEFAMAGESFASQARHADNIAPTMFGGFTLVRSLDPLDIVSLDFPPLWATIIHPQIEIKTAEARAILPKEVLLGTAVRQWANVGSLVAALARGDHELIARSLQDVIVEPVRRSLIPHFDEVKRECLEAGALGGGISGSGPSIFMLSNTEEAAGGVENAMRSVYGKTGIEYLTYVSRVASEGVRTVFAE